MRDPLTGATVPTELDGLLRSHGIRRVVIGGLATDYCVKATVLDALALGYETHVLVDGVRPVDVAPGDGERALAEMERAGARLVRAVAPARLAGRTGARDAPPDHRWPSASTGVAGAFVVDRWIGSLIARGEATRPGR